jgi:hypothetical protein
MGSEYLLMQCDEGCLSASVAEALNYEVLEVKAMLTLAGSG